MEGALLATGMGTLPRFGSEYDVTYEMFQTNKRARPWLSVFEGIDGTATPRMVCDIEGEWPSELHGQFVQNGPGRHELGNRRYQHWLDGDGLVQSWSIQQSGRVIHESRLVATSKVLFDQRRRKLSRIGYGSISNDPWSSAQPVALNVANSNVLSIAGELWALWEGGSPWRLDGVSLETLDSIQLSQASAGLRFGAHPRREQDGTVWNIGFDGAHNNLVVWRFEPGSLRPSFRLSHLAPMSMPHDFVVSEHYLIVLIPPFHFEPSGDPKQSFLDAHTWYPDRSLRLRVFEKQDLSKAFDLELPARWLFHLTNAWEDQSNGIRLQGVGYPDPRLLTEGYRTVMRGAAPRIELSSELLEIVIDPKRRRCSMSPIGLGVNTCEYPITDKRLTGGQHRWVTVLTHTGKTDAKQRVGLMNGVVRVNTETGLTLQHVYADHEVAEEHVYVPQSSKISESDGWLLGTSHDYVDLKTHLNVLRVTEVSIQHVARATLPYLMPLALHGHFSGHFSA